MLSFNSLLKMKTALVALLCMIFLLGLVLFQFLDKKNSQDNLMCKGNLKISHNNYLFRGIIEIKSGAAKGIVNISGFLVFPDKKEYTVQRTVLFTRSSYGVSPVWESNKIIVSNQETAPAESLRNLIPDFYLQSSEVTDVDIIPLDGNARLITKAGVPYLYCNKHTLTSR